MKKTLISQIIDFRTALRIPNSAFPNTLALGVFDLSDSSDRSDSSDSVERDSSGVPVAWRLFKLGANEITRNGEKFTLEFTGEMFDSIVAYFAEKGTLVPLDSEHFLYQLAEKLGVPESEVLNLIPGGRGTFGFGSLEKRPDGLWIANVEYVPLARDLMAQKIWRWFSPVLRGLVDGRLRVTSVAFINEPALNNLDAIAAAADSGPSSAEYPPAMDMKQLIGNLDALAASAESYKQTNTTKKEQSVKQFLAALAGLLGVDAISLGADGSAPEGVVGKIETIKTEICDLRTVKAKFAGFLGSVRNALALAADTAEDVVEGKVLELVEKAKQAEGLKLRVDALELAAETDKFGKLIEKGKADGKLSENMLNSEWMKKQNSISLAAYLEIAQPVVPLGNISKGNLSQEDPVALSAEDKQVCRQLGQSEEEFLKTKKLDRELNKKD